MNAKSATKVPDLFELRWDDWDDHPNWKTVRQHTDKGLVPCDPPVAQVWYSNKQMQRSGQEPYYLLLYDISLAQPKPMSARKRASVARAKETAKTNRTCVACGQLNATKIKRQPKLCDSCFDLQSEIAQARAWLADPNAVIVDTETNELYGSILSIAFLRVCDGKVLLDTFINPNEHIDERPSHHSYYDEEDDWRGFRRNNYTGYEIHGISNEMVRSAPYFGQVWGQIQTLLLFRHILVFNASYDRECLQDDLRRLGYQSIAIPGKWHCVMRWYSAYHGEWSNYYRDYKFVGLGVACAEQDAEITNDMPAHSALGDCLRTLALLKAIAAKHAPLDEEVSVGAK